MNYKRLFFSGNETIPNTGYTCNEIGTHGFLCNLVNPPRDMPLAAPAGCDPEAKVAVLLGEIAPQFLKTFTGLPLPSLKDDDVLGLGLSASLSNGKIVGFSDLKIKEVCAVESDKKDSFYAAVKLPHLSGEYYVRYK